MCITSVTPFVAYTFIRRLWLTPTFEGHVSHTLIHIHAMTHTHSFIQRPWLTHFIRRQLLAHTH